jgi:hypothetical protein
LVIADTEVSSHALACPRSRSLSRMHRLGRRHNEARFPLLLFLLFDKQRTQLRAHKVHEKWNAPEFRAIADFRGGCGGPSRLRALSGSREVKSSIFQMTPQAPRVVARD